MYDILTFGSVTVDFFVRPLEMGISDIDGKRNMNFPVGEKIKMRTELKTVGGGAANSSVGFGRLDLKTGIFGAIGEDDKTKFIINDLQKNQVNTDHLIVHPGKHSNFSIIFLTPQGDRTVFHERTITNDFPPQFWHTVPVSRAYYIGHLYDTAEHILDDLPGEKIIGWNPGKTQFQKGFDHFTKTFPKIDYLVLNVEEAEYFTKLTAGEIDSGEVQQIQTDYANLIHPKIAEVSEIAKKFTDAGVKNVVITDGNKGAQFFDGTNHYWAPSRDCPPLSTLGAGDAFSVGFVGAKLQGIDDQNALLWGSKNAFSVTQFLGAQEGLLNRVELQ